ncbi:chorismate-binding protein [Echinicola marina]|uniref:chorismate-binding protein n=1 Tax=Echinicola marina TaxID=2859768 RepID=UPI001CF695DC|nr:chorismate-binding protein [Echinicola marina]UCS95637.1 chorismate-binding protein [Echinicola marina]
MDISTAQPKTICLEEFISWKLYDALKGGHQIAIWKSPKSTTVQVIVDKTEKIKKVDLDLDQLPAGFIAHTFSQDADHKAYFLKATDYIKLDLDMPISPEELDEDFLSKQTKHTEIKDFIKNFWQQNHVPKTLSDTASSTKEDFINFVSAGISAINSGEMAKVVPSRVKKIKPKSNFDLIKTFLGLCKAYPNTFVNFFHIPNIGTWLGATPEILIKTEGKYFYTMALAGTQRAQGDNPIKNAAWTQKEIEEQALVSRYIVSNFKKIRLREYEENGPKTVLAGNLLHLRSDFRVDMEATNFPQLGAVMLKLLHPTSAVCGTPKDKAMEFILKHEKFDRSFFSGFIGPVNIENQTSIYVNLRTAQILNGEVILYAGAGVTEDSNPEKEWEETSLKCEIIGKFIQ